LRAFNVDATADTEEMGSSCHHAGNNSAIYRGEMLTMDYSVAEIMVYGTTGKQPITPETVSNISCLGVGIHGIEREMKEVKE